MKKIDEISWQVSEEEYRQDKALSYSTISRFDREGFNNLSSLFEPISSPSLTFGSMVDTYITDGPEEYEKIYMPVDMPTIPEKIEQLVKAIYAEHKDELSNLLVAPQKMLLEYADDFDYYPKYKPETRVKGIIEKGGTLYNILKISEGKKVVTMKDHQEAMAACDALKNSENTKWFFTPNPFESGIDRHYQLKFKAVLQYAIPYRCMFDELIVNHNTKEILPIDLKTSGKPEWDFYKSFLNWNYHMQARLYTRILKSVISKDDYFKDFKILPYKFIVVNRNTLTPLVWDFVQNHALGDLQMGKTLSYTLKDPEILGKELWGYLQQQPRTPNGIDTVKSNSLEDWINTL